MIDSKFVIVVTFLLGPIVGAFIMEARRKRAEPNLRPYTWGLYIGLSVLIFYGWFAFAGLIGLFGVFLPGDNTKGDFSRGAALLVLVFCGLISASGYFCLKRHRWAWVVATIATAVPVIWIINFFYGKNRWQEFRR
jgi:uncharacterized membrane protein YfcA